MNKTSNEAIPLIIDDEWHVESVKTVPNAIVNKVASVDTHREYTDDTKEIYLVLPK